MDVPFLADSKIFRIAQVRIFGEQLSVVNTVQKQFQELFLCFWLLVNLSCCQRTGNQELKTRWRVPVDQKRPRSMQREQDTWHLKTTRYGRDHVRGQQIPECPVYLIRGGHCKASPYGKTMQWPLRTTVSQSKVLR